MSDTPQLRDEMRNKLIDKILDSYETDELFNEILKIDIYEIVVDKLRYLNIEQLINIITEGKL